MRKLFLAGMIFALFCSVNQLEANEDMKPLNEKEEKLVEISMYTARGKMPELKQALTAGLESGLTVNEIKEVLVRGNSRGRCRRGEASTSERPIRRNSAARRSRGRSSISLRRSMNF